MRVRSGSVDRLSLDIRRRPSGLGEAVTLSMPKPVEEDVALVGLVALSARVVERVLDPLSVLRWRVCTWFAESIKCGFETGGRAGAREAESSSIAPSA